MKKIIIAVDYNPAAEKVIQTGYIIAKAMGAEVMLIHVFTEPAYYALEFSPITGYQGGFGEGTANMVQDIKKEAERFLAEAVDRIGDRSIKTMLLEGETTTAILKCCKDWDASMIVMGSHSHHGIQRLLVTDIAAYILKHSKIPLLAIPTGE